MFNPTVGICTVLCEEGHETKRTVGSRGGMCPSAPWLVMPMLMCVPEWTDDDDDDDDGGVITMYSATVWLHNDLRRCVSSGSAICAAQQLDWDPSGRSQVHLWDASAGHWEMSGHRSLVQNTRRARSARGHQQRMYHSVISCYFCRSGTDLISLLILLLLFNQSIKTWIHIAPLKQKSTEAPITSTVDTTLKKPSWLKTRFKTLSTNVAVLQFRQKVVPQRWCGCVAAALFVGATVFYEA